MSKRLGTLLLIAALAAPGAASAEPAAPPEPGLLDLALKTREARLAGDHKGWLENAEATLARAPEHPDLLISTARALAVNGRHAEALRLVEQAIARCARVDASTLPEFKDLASDAKLAALTAAGRENLRPKAPPEVFLVIENTEIRPEGITYDPETARLFIGSLNAEIWQVDMKGGLERFAGPASGLREVLGLKVDPGRRLLWAVTGVFPDLFGGEPKQDVGLAGVMAFDLAGGHRVRECWLDERPVLHGFNDLALAGNGDVYVSDSATGSIFRLRGGKCDPERVIQDPDMSFPNGIVLSPDEKRLYVAHIEGISAIDLATGRRSLLSVPPTAAVNSMDGLTRDGADLIGIQGSPYLARVARVRLSEDGLAVREVVTLSSPPPEGTSQTTGVVAGDRFYSVTGVLDPLVSGGTTDRRARILRAKIR